MENQIENTPQEKQIHSLIKAILDLNILVQAYLEHNEKNKCNCTCKNHSTEVPNIGSTGEIITE